MQNQFSPSKFPLAWPTAWPRAKSKKGGHFGIMRDVKSNYSADSYKLRSDLTIEESIKRVLKELDHLGVRAGDYIISSNLEVRLDGLPRSGQSQPLDRGVAVYWQRRGEPMRVMAIDIYERVEHNIAAVAATLGAMRAIQRHGGAQILERAFTGFDALPAPKSCWDILGVTPMSDPAAIRKAFMDKVRDAHPDIGGSHALMAELNNARDEALKKAATL